MDEGKLHLVMLEWHNSAFFALCVCVCVPGVVHSVNDDEVFEGFYNNQR